jgi:aquaporin related protein
MQYWVGPFAGSLVATLLYSVLKRIKYWELNPDQDAVADPQEPESPADQLPHLLSISASHQKRDSVV